MNTKPIPKFTHYFVSDTGIIFSTMPRANQSITNKYRELKTSICQTYKMVHLQRDKKPYKRFVHRLVLETFVGDSPRGYQCRHLDGNPLNNNLSNLKWGTRSENQRDCLRHGTDHRGQKHGMCKLTNEQVLKIYDLARKANKKIRKIDNGGDYKRIGLMFGISCTTVESIVVGRTWGWLTKSGRS